MLRVGHDGAALESGETCRQKQIPPLDLDRRASAVGVERAGGDFHLVLEQRHEDDAPGRGFEQAARHGMPDEAAAAEDHHRPIT